jgi:hypothetical protein
MDSISDTNLYLVSSTNDWPDDDGGNRDVVDELMKYAADERSETVKDQYLCWWVRPNDKLSMTCRSIRPQQLPSTYG